jgi:hypothetical protein
MPKFKSHSLSEPAKDPQTGRAIPDSGNRGQVVLSPLNEAAKLHKSHYNEAIAKGVYTPPKGEDPEKLHRSMMRAQYKSVGREVPREFQD